MPGVLALDTGAISVMLSADREAPFGAILSGHQSRDASTAVQAIEHAPIEERKK